jgi:hypothetical protein
MRRALFLIMVAPSALGAAAWSVDLGLSAQVGATRFTQEPSPDRAGLYALGTQDGGGATGLAGAVGLASTLAHRSGLRLSAEALLDGSSQALDAIYHLPGLDIHRVITWERSGPRYDLLAGWAWPLFARGRLIFVPQVTAGAWYQQWTQWHKSAVVDGGAVQGLPWADAPPDDAGWLLGLGLDMRDRHPGAWFPRACLDLRWRRGHALTDPAGGGDAAMQAFEAVLTVPVILKAW